MVSRRLSSRSCRGAARYGWRSQKTRSCIVFVTIVISSGHCCDPSMFFDERREGRCRCGCSLRGSPTMRSRRTLHTCSAYAYSGSLSRAHLSARADALRWGCSARSPLLLLGLSLPTPPLCCSSRLSSMRMCVAQKQADKQQQYQFKPAQPWRITTWSTCRRTAVHRPQPVQVSRKRAVAVGCVREQLHMLFRSNRCSSSR